MSKKAQAGLVVLLALAVAALVPPHAAAGPYDQTLCPMYVGNLVMEKGFLFFIIEEQGGDNAERGRTVKIANPEGATEEVREKRGRVRFNAHHAEDGGLVVHWESLADEPAK
jgi:hypothetical protein